MPGQTTRYSDFDLLVQRHQGYIRRLCWWHTEGGSEECADLMQECLAALWHYRHTLRPDATAPQERLWVKYHCRSVFSHRKRRHRIPTLHLDQQTLSPTGNPDLPDDPRELIDELASSLSPSEHRLLGLILEGYSIAEISSILGIRPASVSQSRYRIIEKMKQQSKKLNL
ncbi:MAG: sigma-70 family RNA polymerase sigma factor [Bacteroidales bacterium]|nr:sigma-70 family RNA polymerase sigma factor [Bacteroidales bacterium]